MKTSCETMMKKIDKNSADENISISEERAQKEFLKDDKSILEDETKLQQKGDDERHRKRLFKLPEKEPEIIKEPEIKKAPDLQETKPYDNTDLEKLIRKRKEIKQEELQHDVLHSALGQMYKIQGANIDYDEINKMARNNIRDSEELVHESIANDGVEDIMKGYIKGSGCLDDIKQLDINPDIIAASFVNVAKQSSRADIGRLTMIHETLDFDSPRYEKIFDEIRQKDKMAECILNRLDYEMGFSRER